MAKDILRCKTCFSYTMNATCACGGTAITTKPPKYSVEDKYASYRRKAKEQNAEQ